MSGHEFTVDVIQNTLAPTFLATGAAVYLGFVQARLFRVTDRARRLAAENSPDHAARRSLLRRSRILRNAVMLGILSIVLTVLTAVALLFPILLGERTSGQFARLAFAGALLSLAVSSLFALVDASVSLATLWAEASPPDEPPPSS